MRSCLVLAVLLSLALQLLHGPGAAAAPWPGHGLPAKRGSGPDPPPAALLRRAPGSPGAAYAALLQRLRAAEAGAAAPAAPRKRDMHDFFVGLMGRRTAEPGTPAEGHRAAPGDAEPPLRAR
ncbi:tachykinin-3 [Dromaius novaehollandiae]|uniref:tachykinin-3 n=1 Tax=Dromaius novaehollandiae TaxID=8790 RepID=UPI0031203FDA